MILSLCLLFLSFIANALSNLTDSSTDVEDIMSYPEETRPLNHEGKTYNADIVQLRRDIDGWLNAVADRGSDGRCPKALIVPHAALWACGDVAAKAFARVRHDVVRRVFLIGPSHHLPFPKPMLSQFRGYRTPFGEVLVDAKVNALLSESGLFYRVHQTLDAMEHSLENVLPFIGRVLENSNYTLVPFLTGIMTETEMKAVGGILAEYMIESDGNLFVITTDLCHWGHSHNFTLGDPLHPEENVRAIDRPTMDAIATLDPERFQLYPNHSISNMCGDVPVALFLHTVAIAQKRLPSRLSLSFLDYKVGIPVPGSYVGCAAAVLFPSD